MWWYGPYQGQWMGWWMPFHGVLSLLFLALVIAGIVALVRSPRDGRHGRRSSGLAVLEERYARGEIDREEYLQKKHDLGG
jgi:putative membrane protein